MRVAPLACLAATALVVGCAETGTISRANTYSFYYPDLVNYMAASGRVPTAIYGQPFAGGEMTSNEAITSALSLPGFFAQAPFEVTPNALAGEGPRIVLIFDPAAVPGAGAACANPDAVPLTPDASDLAVAAVFCYGDKPVSQAHLLAAAPSDLDDPAFQQSMGRLMLALLPSQDPRRGDGAEFPD